MPTDPTLVAALRDANAAQLVHLSQQHAAIADILSKSSGYAGMFNAGANDHRIVAALLLAVARMQEIAEAETAPRLPDWVIDSTGAEFAYGSRSIERSLPAALSALLEDAP